MPISGALAAMVQRIAVFLDHGLLGGSQPSDSSAFEIF